MIIGYYTQPEDSAYWMDMYREDLEAGGFEIEYDIDFPTKNFKCLVGFQCGVEDGEFYRAYKFYQDGELVKTIIEDDSYSFLEVFEDFPVYFDENSMDFGLECALQQILPYFGHSDPFVIIVDKNDHTRGCFVAPIPIDGDEDEDEDGDMIKKPTYNIDTGGLDGFNGYGNNSRDSLKYLERTIEYLENLNSDEICIKTIIEGCKDNMGYYIKDIAKEEKGIQYFETFKNIMRKDFVDNIDKVDIDSERANICAAYTCRYMLFYSTSESDFIAFSVDDLDNVKTTINSPKFDIIQVIAVYDLETGEKVEGYNNQKED